MTVEWDTQAWLRGVSDGLANVDKVTDDLASDLARAATADQRQNAPRWSGIGGRSISISRGRDEEGRYVEFGPSRRGFYLTWAEYGSSKQAAKPFIRPAIERAIATVWPR